MSRIVRDDQTEYRCFCEASDGAYFNPPADVCFPHTGAQRVDACPPTRLITDEPLTFACSAASAYENVLVTGFGLPCSPPDSTGGCLTSFDGQGTATCLALAGDDDCIGIPVTGCDENLAADLTETVIEGWDCSMSALPGAPRSVCYGPLSTEPEDGSYYPIWTHPPPSIPDQCCRYSADLFACTCVPPDDCADLSGVEVSACPPPADEWAAIED